MFNTTGMIKYPGGEIAFWSSVWTVAGAAIAAVMLTKGLIVFAAVAATLVTGCILVWFGIQPAKWLVVVCLGLATLGALAVLCLDQFSFRTFAQGVLALYSAIRFAVWKGGPRNA